MKSKTNKNVKKPVLRTCAGCGKKKEKKELLRIIRTPEGKIEADLTGKKNGRGVYICRDPECLKKAVKKHALEKSLETHVPEDVYEGINEILEKELTGG